MSHLVGHDEHPVHKTRKEEVDALDHLVSACLAQGNHATFALWIGRKGKKEGEGGGGGTYSMVAYLSSI